MSLSFDIEAKRTRFGLRRSVSMIRLTGANRRNLAAN
jgi:hypothetical protein